jgi:hypothetical protein
MAAARLAQWLFPSVISLPRRARGWQCGVKQRPPVSDNELVARGIDARGIDARGLGDRDS